MTNNPMSERLMKTLGIVDASQKTLEEVTRGLDIDKDTGEIHGYGGEGEDDGMSPFPMMEAPTFDTSTEKETKVPVYEGSDAQQDYQRVRTTTYVMQEGVLMMMAHAAKLAASTEAPTVFRTFKELGELMRGLNKDLMDNQRMIRDVTKDREPAPTPDDLNVTMTTGPDGTTSVTVGKGAPRSSRDLLRVIEETRKAQDEQTRKRKAEEADATVVEKEEKPTDVAEPVVEDTQESVEVTENGTV